jgi:hypothetical protein
VVRVLAFSFQLNGKHFPCAVIRWFNQIGDTTDPDTGQWRHAESDLPFERIPRTVTVVEVSDISVGFKFVAPQLEHQDRGKIS